MSAARLAAPRPAAGLMIRYACSTTTGKDTSRPPRGVGRAYLQGFTDDRSITAPDTALPNRRRNRPHSARTASGWAGRVTAHGHGTTDRPRNARRLAPSAARSEGAQQRSTCVEEYSTSEGRLEPPGPGSLLRDRKSTRLNSSH